MTLALLASNIYAANIELLLDFYWNFAQIPVSVEKKVFFVKGSTVMNFHEYED